MTPAQAKKAADEVKAEIKQLEEKIILLDDQYASLMRVYFGDNLHDGHVQKMLEEAAAKEAFMNWYWSDAGKAERAAAEQAERQPKEQPALSGASQKAEKVLAEIEQLRQQQR